MKLNKSLAFLFVLISALGSGGYAADAEIDPVFQVVWNASSGLMPTEAQPRWRLYGGSLDTKTGNAKGKDILQKDVLRFETPRDETIDGIYLPYRTYFIARPSFWNPIKYWEATMEFSLRVESVATNAKYGATFGFSTETHSFSFSFNEMEIVTNDGQSAFVDTTKFHVYRITWKEDEGAKLYIDGATEPACESMGIAKESRPGIFFGAATNTTGGIAEWKYVAYIQGVILPPE